MEKLLRTDLPGEFVAGAEPPGFGFMPEFSRIRVNLGLRLLIIPGRH